MGDRDALAGPDWEGSRDTIIAEYVLTVDCHVPLRRGGQPNSWSGSDQELEQNLIKQCPPPVC